MRRKRSKAFCYWQDLSSPHQIIWAMLTTNRGRLPLPIGRAPEMNPDAAFESGRHPDDHAERSPPLPELSR
jgi:hypothetical protein